MGDKGGRVIIFHHVELKSSRYFDYRYFSEFQSHEPEFDHLKSVELSEKINCLTFLHSSGGAGLKLLSTNDKVIKFWKIGSRTYRDVQPTKVQGQQIIMPKSQVFNVNVEGKSKQQFKNCHNYNIHSLSISSDREHFISADDLTINLWNMENNWAAYNLIDIKPSDTGDLSEVITYAEFHPNHSD